MGGEEYGWMPWGEVGNNGGIVTGDCEGVISSEGCEVDGMCWVVLEIQADGIHRGKRTH